MHKQQQIYMQIKFILSKIWQNNKDMKNYSSEDLVRLELVIIQELMKKNEMLEKRIEKLERNDK